MNVELNFRVSYAIELVKTNSRARTQYADSQTDWTIVQFSLRTKRRETISRLAGPSSQWAFVSEIYKYIYIYLFKGYHGFHIFLRLEF